MKKNLLIAGLIGVATIPPATAVTKCVALDDGDYTRCTPGDANGFDWTADCTLNGAATHVEGIAICSSVSVGSRGVARATLELSSEFDDNVYCWCKMTSPAVSYYISSDYEYTTAYACYQRCAQQCTIEINDMAFREGLMPTLSD